MAATKKRKTRTASIRESREEIRPEPVTNNSSFMDTIRRYESELSTLLGIFVVIALAAALFFFIRRSSSQTTPQISEIGETTNTENLMGTPSSYTVKANDGLWSIAQEVYGDGYKWTEIAKANNLQSPYTLTEGQQLTIPAAGPSVSPSPSPTATSIATAPTLSPTPTETATATPSPSPTAAPTANPTVVPSARPTTTDAPMSAPTTQAGSTYTVVQGDSLWKIAVAQFNDGYKWVEIFNANKTTIGRNPGIIVPGQTLVLPGK